MPVSLTEWGDERHHLRGVGHNGLLTDYEVFDIVARAVTSDLQVQPQSADEAVNVQITENSSRAVDVVAQDN